ncbi:hypothetical protein Ancab_025748 [Ancistrocladus abbreviatus]
MSRFLHKDGSERNEVAPLHHPSRVKDSIDNTKYRDIGSLFNEAVHSTIYCRESCSYHTGHEPVSDFTSQSKLFKDNIQSKELRALYQLSTYSSNRHLFLP